MIINTKFKVNNMSKRKKHLHLSFTPKALKFLKKQTRRKFRRWINNPENFDINPHSLSKEFDVSWFD
jgi:hypothetical protein